MSALGHHAVNNSRLDKKSRDYNSEGSVYLLLPEVRDVLVIVCIVCLLGLAKLHKAKAHTHPPVS